MAEYIKREAAKSEFNLHFGGVSHAVIASKILDEIPAADVEPVRHGRWEIIVDDYDCEMMKCLHCGSEFYDGDNDTIDHLHNYCPNCGAKMDGGAEQ